MISPSSSIENSSVPIYGVFEQMMQEINQVVREITIVESIKSKHLSHQKCLKYFLIKEIPPISISSM